MRLPHSAICCVLVHCALGQFTEFSSIIDPPGDNAYATLADGLIAPSGEIYVLGGYQNIQEPAFTLARYSSAGDFVWCRKVESTGAGTQVEPRKLVRISTGDLFAFGNYANTSAQQYFVTRITPQGTVLWTRSYRQEITGSDYGFSSIVATSDDHLVISMGLVDRTVAMRLDADGNVLWARNYLTDLSPTAKNPGFDFAATPDGGVLLTEKAEDDIFLVRLMSDGGILWAVRYPNGGYCHTHTATLLSDAGFLIAGSRDAHPFAARVGSDGQMIWQKEYGFDEGTVEFFDQAAELSDEGYLLTPSRNSSGIMSLRLSPLGIPQGVRTVAGGGYMTLIGAQGGGVVLAGRTLLEINGGFENAMLLTCTDETLQLDCLQGSTGATATDIPIPTPILGCIATDEPIITDTVATFVSDASFARRSLCAAFVGLPEGPSTATLAFYPSPAIRGQTISVVCEGAASLQCLSSDGRVVSDQVVRSGNGRADVRTVDLSPGLYLLRALDRSGRTWATERAVVE